MGRWGSWHTKGQNRLSVQNDAQPTKASIPTSRALDFSTDSNDCFKQLFDPSNLERLLSETAAQNELDTRTRLLDASGPVFAERGYDRATVREICAAAGVNIAAVGYHFGDKLGLYRQLIRQVRESRLRQFPTPDNAGENPAVTLGRIVRTLMSRILAADPSGWESQLFMREMQNPTPVFADIVIEYFKPLHDRLLQTITALADDESIPDHVIQQLALSVVGQCVHYKVGADAIRMLVPIDQIESHFDVDTISRHITAVTLAAIRSDDVIRPQSETCINLP